MDNDELPDYLLGVAVVLTGIGVSLWVGGIRRFGQMFVTGGVLLALVYVTFAVYLIGFE